MFLRQRKITAFGLSLLLAIPLFFSVAVLVKQKLIQHLREERFDMELSETVIVSPGEFHWVKKGKEVIIGDKLFDVESYKTEGNKIVLTGFFDVKESSLVQHIKKLAEQDDKSSNPFNLQVIKLLLSSAYTNDPEVTYKEYWKFISKQYYLFDENILVFSLQLISPPPRI